jgi:predicted DNA binding protein
MVINNSTQASVAPDEQIFRAALDIAQHGCPNSDVTEVYPAARIESVSDAHVEEAQKKQLLRLETERVSVDQFVSTYDDHELVTDVAVYPHVGSERVAHLSTTIDYTPLTSVSQILADHGAYRGHGATASNGSEKWWVFFECHETLSEIIDDLEAEGSDVRIRRKEQVTLQSEQSPQSPLTELSPRQRETLLVAQELGYFGPNDGATLEDIAAELDLSTSSVWEHLSKATEQVINEVTANYR